MLLTASHPGCSLETRHAQSLAAEPFPQQRNPLVHATVANQPPGSVQAGTNQIALCGAATSSTDEATALSSFFQSPHTAEELVTLAMQRHPEIRAAARQVAAEGQTIPQVTALPDPVLSNIWWPITDHSPQTASGRMPYTMSLTQRFPWCGKLQLRGEVADLETQMAITRLAQVQLRIAEAVKQSYYEMFFDQKALRITQESDKLLTLYVKVAEARYKVGQVSQQDVLRIQVEQRRIRDQLITFQRENGVAQADLTRLLAISPEIELKTGASLNLPSVPQQIEQLYNLAIAQRPELRERLLAIVRDERKVDLAKLEYYPDVMVGFNWQVMTSGASLARTADGKDNLGLTVSVNLPIWKERLQAGVAEARERTAASAARYDSERDETMRQVRRLTIQARALEEQIKLFRDDILPKAEQTLQVSAADYRVGKVSVLQLLDNWGQLLRFQIQLARLESSLGQVLASLERVLGQLITSDPVQQTRPEGAMKGNAPMSHEGRQRPVTPQ